MQVEKRKNIERKMSKTKLQSIVIYLSVPAMLGKGQSAKEIGDNLAQNWAQSSTRTTKIWAQFSAQTKRDLVTILWVIDENVGTNLQAFYSSSAVWKHKNSNYMKKMYFLTNLMTIRAGCHANRAGRRGIRAGHMIWRAGQLRVHSQHPKKYA